jgi:hypothetical protein
VALFVATRTVGARAADLQLPLPPAVGTASVGLLQPGGDAVSVKLGTGAAASPVLPTPVSAQITVGDPLAAWAAPAAHEGGLSTESVQALTPLGAAPGWARSMFTSAWRTFGAQTLTGEVLGSSPTRSAGASLPWAPGGDGRSAAGAAGGGAAAACLPALWWGSAALKRRHRPSSERRSGRTVSSRDRPG